MKTSHYQNEVTALIDAMDADVQLLSVWMNDAMTPVFIASRQKVILEEMREEILAYIQKKPNEKASKSLERIDQLIELNERLFSLASENRMLQLSAQHAARELSAKIAENEKLKNELQAVEKAWKAE